MSRFKVILVLLLFPFNLSTQQKPTDVKVTLIVSKKIKCGDAIYLPYNNASDSTDTRMP